MRGFSKIAVFRLISADFRPFGGFVPHITTVFSSWVQDQSGRITTWLEESVLNSQVAPHRPATAMNMLRSGCRHYCHCLVARRRKSRDYAHVRRSGFDHEKRALKSKRFQVPSAKTSRFQPKHRYLPFWKDFDYARLTTRAMPPGAWNMHVSRPLASHEHS